MPWSDTISRRNMLKLLGVAGVAAASGETTGEGTGPGDDPSGGDAPGKGRTKLTLLHDTHVHGRLGDPDANANVENYFGLMDYLAARSEHALRLGNGDDLGSSAFSNEFEGRHTVDAFEAGNLNHDTPGNHDFDFGPEILRRRIAESDFQWVTANVRDAAGGTFGTEQGVEAFDLVGVEDVTVGITGILTEEARVVTNLGDNEVLDPVEALGEVVPEMRSAGAEVVIVLSHVINQVAREVARQVDGIDVIVGDDAGAVEGAEVINDTVLAFVGDEYDYLGELTLDVRGAGRRIHGYDFTLHELDEVVPELGIEPNADVEIVADSYRNRIESEVVGVTEVPLNCRTKDNRTEETNVGNFAADTIVGDVGTDVAVQNGGGVRTDTLYPAGEVTDLTVEQIFPFGNEIVALEVTGETLLDALENGVSQVEEVDGRFPQVGGLSFTWDPDAEPGDRVGSVTVGGDPLDESATYTLGTNTFLAGGGDGYEMLADLDPVETGAGLAEAVIDRIEAETPIAPETEGRITRV